MWKVSNGGKYVAYNDIGGWTADPATAASMAAYAGRPVETAASSTLYIPRDERDEVGAFLLARYLLGADAAVSGTPPHMPDPPAVDPRADY